MSANDNFSLHDDGGTFSFHDDDYPIFLDGSVPASNKGDAPAKPPQIITTNTLSNIKLPVLQKDDYDTWAMEMEHYLEYIDNEVWKVIQNGNSRRHPVYKDLHLDVEKPTRKDLSHYVHRGGELYESSVFGSSIGAWDYCPSLLLPTCTKQMACQSGEIKHLLDMV
ncbi:hypothetical protein Tco_0168206 [Tanacetum coccineum]